MRRIVIDAYRLWGRILCRAAVAVFLLSATRLQAQVIRLPAVMPPSEQHPGELTSHPDFESSLIQPPPGFPQPEPVQTANPDRPPDTRDGMFQKLIFDGTWLAPGRSLGMGMTELELKTILALPCPTRNSPLIITPGFSVNYLEGPTAIDVPARVYDAYTQFRWMSRLTPRFGIDLVFTPGVFSDFEQGADEAFRITGRGAGMFTWTPNTKIVLGLAYLNRDDVDYLPIGGLIWTPNDDLQIDLLFPQPKIARRIYWDGAFGEKVQDWIYIAGEFGTDVWAVRRASGNNDVLTYRDLRLIIGLERKCIGCLDWRLELGYVFGREIRYRRSPDVGVSDTVMLRAGMTY